MRCRKAFQKELFRCWKCVRSSAAPETLLSRAAEEGLASFVSMRTCGMEWNAESVSRVLGIQLRQAAYLIENTEAIVERAVECGSAPLDTRVMRDYFMLTDAEAELALPGYYVGLYFTYLAVRNGVDFNAFSAMPADKVAELWLKNYERWKR